MPGRMKTVSVSVPIIARHPSASFIHHRARLEPAGGAVKMVKLKQPGGSLAVPVVAIYWNAYHRR